MNRNWLTYVAITASLIAGFICSTAFADNKGMRLGGGSVRSSFSGGNTGGSQPRMQFQQNNSIRNSIQSSNFGGMQSQFKNHGIQTQIKNHVQQSPVRGITQQNLGIQNQIENHVIQSPVRGITQQDLRGRIGQAVNGNGITQKLPQIQIQRGNGIPGLINGSTNGVARIGIGNPNLKTTVNSAVAKCLDPHFSKGCSPHGNKCSPCLMDWNPTCKPWWWTCHKHYCNQPIYYPVCTRPIVIQVPVYVGVPVVEEPLVQVPVGSTITMQALGSGDLAGRMILVMDKVSLEAQVIEWKEGAVTATLPMFALAAPMPAELVIVRADGQPATSMKIELVPAQPVAAVDPNVQPAQATQPAGELSAAAALFQ
jgi:hypothetical protein